MGLNRKDGTLKGVEAHIKYGEGKDWQYQRVQGWTTWADESERDFSILVNLEDGIEVELTFSASALERILDDIVLHTHGFVSVD